MRTPLRRAAIAGAIALVAAASLAAQQRPPARAAAAGTVDSGFVEVDRGRIWYEATGQGPVVVLVHGGFGDRRMWDDQFRALARDFRVVRYDHRGFGRSTAPDSAYSAVADLVRLLDRVGAERAHLVGNSMGASLVIDFARLHPSRVGRVVAAAAGANGFRYTDEEIESVRAVFRAAQSEGAARAAEMWFRHPMVKVTSRTPALAPRLRRMIDDNRGFFSMQHWPGDSLVPPTFEVLDRIRTPILLVLGAADTPTVSRNVRATAERLPNARLVVMPDADHLPQMVAPAEFNALVREFLREK
jgi:pimeloyl-ACP methyl ester carboxylesterase